MEVFCSSFLPEGVFRVFWGRFLSVSGHRFFTVFLAFFYRFLDVFFEFSSSHVLFPYLSINVFLQFSVRFFTVFCTFYCSCLDRFLCVFGPGPRQSGKPEKNLHEVFFQLSIYIYPHTSPINPLYIPL